MQRERAQPALAGEQFDEVLAAARRNAGWALERIFQTFAPRVQGYLRAQGSAEPDELTNDVFLGVFRALDRFEGDAAAFRSWVFTITRNRLVDERRRRARHRVVVPGDPVDYREHVGGDAEAEALANLDADWAVELIARLAPDQRDVLLLRVVGDLTIDQIAGVVGKKPGAVKALQRRGLAAAKRVLDRQGVSLHRSSRV